MAELRIPLDADNEFRDDSEIRRGPELSRAQRFQGIVTLVLFAAFVVALIVYSALDKLSPE